ncbi:MBL fold metallo-hydrolase [Ktedonosporobacter rubrisoli]|uniref:MBL fold metallo-hydrolase n=1 Tax=Ktedonosporobacter rubrisoli TaxID=2509675 RepID=A0A4P6JQV4_KTERU|nr:MBL fold metallo-hydrolase [Ktedonosporobacter rubrisoli]QBD77725.1 MBL fold metallo-hydrolase [Ktedonosporobacter rubrisoli]
MPSSSDQLISVPQMSNDSRVRVFRRHFSEKGEFEGLEVDGYVIISNRYVIVCDTLLCPEDMDILMDEIREELTGRQLLVVNSHADWDHAWGNHYFADSLAVAIIGHEGCRARLLGQEARTELASFQQRYATFSNVVLTPPNVTFKQGMTIYGGDLTIELFHAPGHCHDHIAIWLPEISLLLAFDAAEMPLPIIENRFAVPAMFATLEHFLSLKPQRVLCSHGKTIGVDLVGKNLAYLQEVERRCKMLLQKQRPDAQELEHAAALIQYPLDEVVAGATASKGPVDEAFYSWAHDNNVRCILQWLMR